MTEKASTRPGPLVRWFPNNEWVLLVVLAIEVGVFSVTGDHFFSVPNAFEIVRLSAEVGLLALGLTPVIKTGGIDLSVGSMMGLSAVIFGASWSALGLPWGLAAALALLVGGAGGALHGILITRLRVPPLIVTLGTFSLYRGLAEALTGGYVSYTGFPASFLAFGQGYIGGVVPAQVPLLAAVFAALWLLLHRATLGREITAIGFNSAGARFAGIAVPSVLLRVYVICGLCSALAGIVFVARLGQAKADAGLGYELLAIAAVVLGGTSITGGRGTLSGTLFGLLCLVVLQNGLRLSGQPGGDRRALRRPDPARRHHPQPVLGPRPAFRPGLAAPRPGVGRPFHHEKQPARHPRRSHPRRRPARRRINWHLVRVLAARFGRRRARRSAKLVVALHRPNRRPTPTSSRVGNRARKKRRGKSASTSSGTVPRIRIPRSKMKSSMPG